MTNWKVMRLCERQLRDINPDDILMDGLYRKCDVYKGGGGYDKFPQIFNERLCKKQEFMRIIGLPINTILDCKSTQFVVQLKGCPLNCPYCYVTPDGIHTGVCELVSTAQLAADFNTTGLSVFHLMGGAPALYIENWEELIMSLGSNVIFHSDLLLIEKEYSQEVIQALAHHHYNSLYAVSIKGTTPEEFKKNTGVHWNEELFWNNLDKLVFNNFPFYFTFTGLPETSVERFRQLLLHRYGFSIGNLMMKDSFSLKIIQYEAYLRRKVK